MADVGGNWMTICLGAKRMQGEVHEDLIASREEASVSSDGRGVAAIACSLEHGGFWYGINGEIA